MFDPTKLLIPLFWGMVGLMQRKLFLVLPFLYFVRYICSFKHRLKGIICGTMTGWALTPIGRCWVSGIGTMIDFFHKFAMLSDTKMRYGLYPLYHIALLKDFASLASLTGRMNPITVQPLLHCYLLWHNMR